MSDSPTLSFQGGTLVITHRPQSDPPGVPFQWIKGKWRCEAYHYPAIRHLEGRDVVPRWQPLDCVLDGSRQPHDYQQEAIGAWEQAGRRGSIVLPTGAGKTFVAIQAIHRANRSTLVVAPTIDLLHQWYARLGNALNTEIGVYYGGEKTVLPVTVTTYHSAGDLIALHGNEFKLLIFDEVHHLPAPSWGETALMSPSPFRLGLTATYPDAGEMGDGRWQIDELIGPIIYQKRVSDLVGQRLAEYRTERVRADLTEEERAQYEADFAIYAGFFRARRLRETHGAGWLRELTRLSAFEREARAALLARHRILRLLAGCEGKLSALEKLLRENIHEQILVFTETNDTVYEISRRHLIPALTHETKAAERKRLLEAFRDGHYPAIVTSKVLNEGVDVPEAKIAIVLGGTSSAREYIQRLGRVLRKTGSREAVLYEVIARDTVDEGRAQRRRPKAGTL
ncbi:MAG: DEAD/DEAH box helicase [Anaerolineae bacterium]|nr:DEAD/DEAH box helicase [Anaerolineae bacterium]